MLTASAAPHPAAPPASSPTSLFPVFLPFPFPRFSGGVPAIFPMRDDPRLRGPKVLFDANTLERDG